MPLETRPLPGGLGVELLGLDATAIADDEVIARIGQLFVEHSLLYAHIDDLTETQQLRIAGAIGAPTARGAYGTSPDRGGDGGSGSDGATAPNPNMYVSNTRSDGILGKGRLDYHHDHLFYSEPLKALMLYAIEVPDSGSETRFRSGVAALDSLPDEIRDQVRGIDCFHLYDAVKLAERRYRDWDHPDTATPGSQRDWKPWVWRQPETGREALLLSQSTCDFRGIDRDDGIALYQRIYDHLQAREGEIAALHQHWRPGDLVIWDNLMVAHARMPFDKTQPRTLRRTPILEEAS